MHRRRKSTRREGNTAYAPPHTPPHPVLPYGWTARFDTRYQRFYYVDLATKRTQWEMPLVAVNAPIQGRASGEYHRPLSFPDGIETPEPREQDTGGRGEQRLLICASGEGGSGGQGSGENRGGVPGLAAVHCTERRHIELMAVIIDQYITRNGLMISRVTVGKITLDLSMYMDQQKLWTSQWEPGPAEPHNREK
ncbi:uncharacterized protein H6S33_002262 [Morchella sextelata]|uniref:uncharacterized protein n=1 Tax=Morchella sextelata TaxID=1174677 RepID=UPI001D03D7FB|nr:uncharacterized protein H6S33_002262 [Morchella sextelata]KAH0608210.1 hypothetical protein H6S33_002262 [Morchella sextelata]